MQSKMALITFLESGGHDREPPRQQPPARAPCSSPSSRSIRRSTTASPVGSGRPDNTLPGSQPGIDNTLPGGGHISGQPIVPGKKLHREVARVRRADPRAR